MKFVQFKKMETGTFLFIIFLEAFYEKDLFYIFGIFLRKESRSFLLCEHVNNLIMKLIRGNTRYAYMQNIFALLDRTNFTLRDD